MKKKVALANNPLARIKLLRGGPFDEQTYGYSEHMGSTLTFTAKGMTGYYNKGSWVPL